MTDKELEEIDEELVRIKLRLSAIERMLLRVHIKPLDLVGKFV